jgi:hypothetical protein
MGNHPLGWMAAMSMVMASPASAAINQQVLPVEVCVVAPRVQPLAEVDAFGVVPTARPRLVVLEPLQEIRILRQGQPAWKRLGSPSQPISTPLDWPTAPIAPNELVLLQLRPLKAAPEAFAHVQLSGASASRMRSTQQLIQRLGSNGKAWLQAFEAALVSDDVPLAWSLLFHPRSPRTSDLIILRQEVIRRGCGP